MIRSTIKAAAAALCGLVLATTAQAATVTSITVSNLGIQGNQMYILSPDLPAGCGSFLYLSLANSNYNASYIMSLALSARLANMKISRVDYTPGSTCTIDLLQL